MHLSFMPVMSSLLQAVDQHYIKNQYKTRPTGVEK